MRRRLRTRLLAVTAVPGIVLMTTVSSGVATAQTPPTQAAVVLELVDQSTWVHQEDDFSVKFRVTGPLEGALVRLRIYDKLDSRRAFTDSLTGELGGENAARPDVRLSELTPLDPFGTVEVRYPVGENGAGLNADDEYGVYPVKLVIADAGGDSLAELVTYLLLLPAPNEAFKPLSLAVVMDIGAPPSLQPDGRIDPGDNELDQIDRRISVIEQARSIPLTVAPVPETLDALVTADNAKLTALKNAMPGRPLLARPYVDIDLDSLSAANMLGQAPAEISAGAKTVENLLGQDYEHDIWLSGPTVGENEATALPGLGYPEAIVPSSAVTKIPGRDDVSIARESQEPVVLADGGPLAFVSDDALAQRLLGNRGRLDAQLFVAELTAIWSETPSRPRDMVVRIPAQGALDPAIVTRALADLAEGQAVKVIAIGQMVQQLALADGEQPVVAELAPKGEFDDLDSLRAPLDSAYLTVSGLASMLDDQALTSSLRQSLLVAPGAQTPTEKRQAYIDRVHETEAALVDTINTPTRFRITLTAREGTIPIRIENASEREVLVKVHLSSSQLEFPDGDSIDVRVPPGAKRVDVQVRTRASGAFPLGVSVTSPDGRIVLDRTTFTIRSTAISGVGLFLSIGAGLFLLIWWARHWRTARRSSRLIPEHPAGRALHERAPIRSTR
jgi:hypothetical protein